MPEEYNQRSPFYSFDGKRLYFQAHLKSSKGFDQKEKFYFVTRTHDGWSKPKLLDHVFNKYSIHWQFSLDKKNNLYFGGQLRGKENTGGIYFSQFKNKKYCEPKLILKHQQLKEFVFAPAISKDGDYIVFVRCLPRGSKSLRIFSLYVTFKNSNNQWTEPLDLGEKMNMGGGQPRISPDGKYLFFVERNKCFWIDTEILNSLKKEQE